MVLSWESSKINSYWHSALKGQMMTGLKVYEDCLITYSFLDQSLALPQTGYINYIHRVETITIPVNRNW
jgi:hypothetical protein